jgi:hypothetical protein
VHFFSPTMKMATARAPFPFFHPLARNPQTLGQFSPHPVPAAAAPIHHGPRPPPQSPSHGLATSRAVTTSRPSRRHRRLAVPWFTWRPGVRLSHRAVVLHQPPTPSLALTSGVGVLQDPSTCGTHLICVLIQDAEVQNNGEEGPPWTVVRRSPGRPPNFRHQDLHEEAT